MTNGSNLIRGYDPRTGQELWRLGGSSKITAPTPVFSDDLFVSPAAARPSGRFSSCDRAHAATSRCQMANGTAKRRLEPDRPRLLHADTAVYHGILYLLDNSGVLDAYDLRSGKELIGSGFPVSAAVQRIACRCRRQDLPIERRRGHARDRRRATVQARLDQFDGRAADGHARTVRGCDVRSLVEEPVRHRTKAIASMIDFTSRRIGRRTFLLAGLAATMPMRTLSAQTPSLVTFTDWRSASREARDRGVQQCLDRIRTSDGSIRAWVQVAPQKATGEGPLAGIPFGAKDIMETRGLSTEYGSPVYKGRIGTDDAAIVRELRQRGAMLLGKTQTTAFAYSTPAPTRNPRNPEHTPGGSSSGSAAAVAAGMVPFALGTQTKGSVLRPASFCGVTGFKASYGLLSLEGVLPFAKSLDTLGFFTHTPGDMLALWESLGHSAGQSAEFPLGAPDPPPDVEPAMATRFEAALARLRGAGLSIRPIDIADMLVKLDAAATTVMFYEGARFHEQRFNEHGSRLADLADLVREGLQISAAPVRRSPAVHRGMQNAGRRAVQSHARDPGARGHGNRSEGSGLDRRSANERPVDGSGHTGRFHPDAGGGRAASRAAAHRRPRR